MQHTTAQVDDLIRERFSTESRITPSSELASDLGLDSMGMLELAAAVEQRFDVEFQPGDEYDIATIADLVRLIEMKRRER